MPPQVQNPTVCEDCQHSRLLCQAGQKVCCSHLVIALRNSASTIFAGPIVSLCGELSLFPAIL